MKKVSLKYISDSLGLSKSTISLVLNGRGDERRIGAETQQRVIKFAKEHNYKADLLARSLSTGKSNTIGLIVPNIADTFFSQIAMRIEKRAELSGYHVIFSNTDESPIKESKAINSMLDRKVDGLIIVSSEQNREDILQLKENNFPFVIIARQYKDIQTNTILIDEIGGMEQAVELLVKSGRENIAFITVALDIKSLREREIGYVQTMQKHNLEVKDNYIQAIDYNNIEESMHNAINKIVTSKDKVDSIICSTQYLTVAALKELKRLKIKIPQQLALVSYGYKNDFELFNPSISGINLPIQQMGDAAVNLLLENINKEVTEYKSIEMKTDLIIGESTGEL